jgi:hypothetical protein
VLIGVAAVIVAAVVVLAWHPWHTASRKTWEAAPTVPSRPTPAERRWLSGLADWIGFVRDAQEDPTNLAVRECGARLGDLPSPTSRLRDVRALAADTCAAFTAAAVDRRGSGLSWDAQRAGRANAEDTEAHRDLRLLLLSLGTREAPGSRVVALYSHIAAKLSGGDATARCWDNRANWEAVSESMARTEPRLRNLLGFAVPWERRIELSPSVCASLASIRRGRVPIDAIEVLTHESEHLAGPDGISNEAKTDCYAAQRMYLTAKALGVPAATLRRGASLYLRYMQPLLPPEYHSSQCREGGAYDLTPRDGRWP